MMPGSMSTTWQICTNIRRPPQPPNPPPSPPAPRQRLAPTIYYPLLFPPPSIRRPSRGRITHGIDSAW